MTGEETRLDALPPGGGIQSGPRLQGPLCAFLQPGSAPGWGGNDYHPPPLALRQSASLPQTSFFGTSLEAAVATTAFADASDFSAAAALVAVAVFAFAAADAFAGAVAFAGAGVNLALGSVSAATRADACVRASAGSGVAIEEPKPAVTPAAAAIRVTNRVRGILFILCSARVVNRFRASGDRRRVR